MMSTKPRDFSRRRADSSQLASSMRTLTPLLSAERQVASSASPVVKTYWFGNLSVMLASSGTSNGSGSASTRSRTPSGIPVSRTSTSMGSIRSPRCSSPIVACRLGGRQRLPDLPDLEPRAVLAHELRLLAAARAHPHRASITDARPAAHALLEQHLHGPPHLCLPRDLRHRREHRRRPAGERLVAPLQQLAKGLRHEALAARRAVVRRDDDLDLRPQVLRREDVLGRPRADDERDVLA